MNLKIGDLVKAEGHKIGVIVSAPIETPSGYTVKIAFNNKVLSMYTWCLEPVSLKKSPSKHSHC